MAQEAVVYRGTEPRVRAVEWLTVERAGYGLAALIALGVRLWGLGVVPLGPEEAVQAWPAVAAINGAAPDLAGVSPLLHTLQRMTFSLFGATDAGARFWPALLAGLSPLLFYFLRRQLTPGGALAAAFIWSLSPLGVWSSRLAVGDALVPTLALFLLAVLAQPMAGRFQAGAIGLGVGCLLVSGANAYTVLVAGLIAALWWAPQLRELGIQLRRYARYGLVGLLAALLIASFFLAEPAGLAAGADLAGRWVSDLVPGRGEFSVLEIIARLLLSELFVVAFGIAGLVWALRNHDRTGAYLSLATSVALVVAVVGRGRHPIDLALVALGLTLLAGPAIARVLAHAYAWRRERDPWLLVLVTLALAFSAAFAIPSGFNQTNSADWRTLYLSIGITTLVMSLIVWVAYGIWDNWRVVVTALPVVPLVFGLGWHTGQMVSVSFDRGAWRQPGILHEAPATDSVDLQAALRDLSALHGGGAREANIDVAVPDLVTDSLVPVLRWQLRDFPNTRFSASVPAGPAPLVLTPAEEQPVLQAYSGAEFAILQRWMPTLAADTASSLRWILYRETYTPPAKVRIILWVNKGDE